MAKTQAVGGNLTIRRRSTLPVGGRSPVGELQIYFAARQVATGGDV
jgi:hypothetical protein